MERGDLVRDDTYEEEREKRKRDEGHKWKVRGCQTTSVIL